MSASVSSFRMIFVMTLIASICGGLIVSSYVYTAPLIQKNQELLIQEAAMAVLPQAKQMQSLVDSASQMKYFQGIDASGKPCGFALEAKGKGFADVIRVLYAYDASQRIITGFKVVESKETPGIGDKIQSDTLFLQNFRALYVTQPIVAVKHGKKATASQIDGIMGATISSKAVAKLLQQSAQTDLPRVQAYWEAHHVQ